MCKGPSIVYICSPAHTHHWIINNVASYTCAYPGMLIQTLLWKKLILLKHACCSQLSTTPDHFKVKHFHSTVWLLLCLPSKSCKQPCIQNNPQMQVYKYLLWRLNLIVRSLPIPSPSINTTLCQPCNINILAKSINRTSL